VAGTSYVGTSGFAYQEWKGPFYPEDLPDTEMLRHYSGRFPSVEINYTFRRYPATKTLTGWAEKTTEDFRFVLKAHGRITHTKRLADADDDVSEFLERARALGSRLGPILFQCPPSLRFDRRLIEGFVGYLPPTFRYAMEFRHPSWEEARGILADQGVAWCLAETDERDPGARTAEPFGYLRLRKTAYTDDELSGWGAWIRQQVDADRDVFAFFKHEEGAVGPRHAERLLSLMTVGTGDHGAGEEGVPFSP
jgi:uncharacterized protein YecE (DUF72 family)